MAFGSSSSYSPGSASASSSYSSASSSYSSASAVSSAGSAASLIVFCWLRCFLLQLREPV